MIAKQIMLVVTLLLFATTGLAQSRQLSDLANRLATESNDLADASYRAYTSSFRGNRGDLEAVMLAQQFSGATQLFNRMVLDRRRSQELKDASQLIQDLARSLGRYNLQTNRWNTIQRYLSDISRELETHGNNNNNNPFPGGDRPGGGQDYYSSGRMNWRGRVDDDVRITVRGGTAEVKTLGGTPNTDYGQAFTASIPRRRVTVQLTVKRGRGQVVIEEQPSRENDFACVVRIRDPRGGASEYEFELSW
jgi:hypothetical protein